MAMGSAADTNGDLQLSLHKAPQPVLLQLVRLAEKHGVGVTFQTYSSNEGLVSWWSMPAGASQAGRWRRRLT
jgi:hypothetical protein